MTNNFAQLDYLPWVQAEHAHVPELPYIYKARYRIITGTPQVLVQHCYLSLPQKLKAFAEFTAELEHLLSVHPLAKNYPRFALGEHELLAAYEKL